MASSIISTRIDTDLSAALDRLAEARQRSRAWIARDLLEKGVRQEIEFSQFVQAGLDDYAAGRTVSHDALTRQLRKKWPAGLAD